MIVSRNGNQHVEFHERSAYGGIRTIRLPLELFLLAAAEAQNMAEMRLKVYEMAPPEGRLNHAGKRAMTKGVGA